MSPTIFGWIMSSSTFLLLLGKLIFNAWLNKWWAGGNLILLTDEVFSWVAWIFMSMDVYNIETYQYTFRPLRFVSYFVGVIYVVFYTILMAASFEEFYVRDEMTETDAQSFPDFLRGITLVYLVGNFFATYAVNLVVVLKELTMDQLAWTKEEDFVPNEIEGLGWNIDLLYWFNISEDYDSHVTTFRDKFAAVYF